MSNTALFVLCAGVPLLFGLWAQMRVKRTFQRYSQVQPHNGMTGAQAAAAVLQSSGLPNLQIRPIEGQLSDHYDPRNKTLNLSADVGNASSGDPSAKWPASWWDARSDSTSARSGPSPTHAASRYAARAGSSRSSAS